MITPQGRFGCVVYPGRGSDAKEHRRRIFALCGDHKIKPLVIRRMQEIAGSGRPGRQFQSHSENEPTKIGLLGRLGRAFSTHAQRHREVESSGSSLVQQNDIKTGVPAVPESRVVPHRLLSEHEWAILVRAGAQNDLVIIEALNLFNAKIVE